MTTYAQYFCHFTKEGIQQRIDKSHSVGIIPAPAYERLTKLVKIAAEDRSHIVAMGVSTAMLNQCIIYDLFRLDCFKFFLVEGARNTSLNAKTLLDTMTYLDLNMRTFENLDVMQSVVTIMVALATLYCDAMGKTVECKTLLGLSADKTKEDLTRTFTAAQELLGDCRHFSKKLYDGKVGRYLDLPRQVVSNVKNSRAY
jgi:hypothetical protein